MTHARGDQRDELYEVTEEIYKDREWLRIPENVARARCISGLLWNCTDVIPSDIRDLLDDIGVSYLHDYERGKKIGSCAQLARMIR